MAPRQPRRPPDRSRARNKPAIPSFSDIQREVGGHTGEHYVEASLRTTRVTAAVPPISHAMDETPITARQRTMSPTIALAVQDAKAGDDSSLLPYQPTPSIDPPRPRTLAAGYDRESRTLRVRFRDGTPWEYYGVEPNEWRNFRRVKSPGRYINRVLNNHPYARGDF